ncbi:hypothetical protein F8S13_22210 [Chloroflexia bacterium SDU3-3]|nr:hypothetical protein F8S13_22210 [Chloroflexia bacterium SDU3-3]
MTTPFSAGPQAVGYLHQVRYALYLLLIESEEAGIIIEGLDDIEIQTSPGHINLAQLKHHIKNNANLTDTSTDLWKTLRIWSEQLSTHQWNPAFTKLNLITTAKAPENSASWNLKSHDKRNIDKAHELLTRAINNSNSKDPTLRDCFNAFNKLKKADQLNMLKSITILDDSSNILDLEKNIKQRIRFAAPPSDLKCDRLYNELEGWWFSQAVHHLTSGSKNPITLTSLRNKLWSITDQFTSDNLPIEFAERSPEVIDPEKDDRMFVKQLRYIDSRTERINQAILDYYRAFEQRSKWVHDQLLIDDELITYERKLIDVWENYRITILENEPSSGLDSEEHCREIGRNILKLLFQESNIRIKPSVDEQFIFRGSYHILADKRKPQVFWHPKFLERLEELLT